MKVLKNFLDHHNSGFKIPDAHKDAVADKMSRLNNARNADRLIYFFELLQYLNAISKELEPLSTRVPDKVSDTEGSGSARCMTILCSIIIAIFP
ncbi:hypothetical protein KRR40_41190 [Niabella defluvii]|nr:hypothetical protein KRR40_41190 [Niabella sp. I65]